ncbi:hypothetical protein O1L68_03995 [Streptomyces lydicus]|nr:hypothetical protein [Streptomyces lydicus]
MCTPAGAGDRRPARNWRASLAPPCPATTGCAGRALRPGRPPPRGRQPHPSAAARPDGATDACLLLLTARPTAARDADTGDATSATGLATAVREALRAGAWSAWWPGTRPGRSVLLLVSLDRRAAVRTVTAEAFRRCDLPVPRLLRINVVDAARREA